MKRFAGNKRVKIVKNGGAATARAGWFENMSVTDIFSISCYYVVFDYGAEFAVIIEWHGAPDGHIFERNFTGKCRGASAIVKPQGSIPGSFLRGV
jgi:hypothetical protein